MLVSCWSTKGGTGTTIVAAALSLLLARSPAGALAVDLAGDLPLALGLSSDHPEGRPGAAQWLAAAPDVPADALARLEEPVVEGARLVRRGAGPLPAAGGELLAGLLASDPRAVVVDCGRLDAAAPAAGTAVAAASSTSLLVLRPCYLAVRSAAAAPVHPTGIVLVADRRRALGPSDVEGWIGAPVVARVRVTDEIARAVDAGLLSGRPPRTLLHDLRHVA